VTYGWIRNTLELDRLAVSPGLRPALDAQPQIQIEGEIEVQWDGSENLVSPWRGTVTFSVPPSRKT
jgi:hypothetical protein